MGDALNAAGPRRATRQRAAVADVLDRTDGFATAQQLHLLLVETGESVGLTTVYRSLHALASAGVVDAVPGPFGETLYRRCRRQREHHHHVVCTACGFTVEVDDLDAADWALARAAALGFTSVRPTIDVFGICPRCAA